MFYVEYLISFVLAFIVAFSATPIAKKLAFKVGAIDIPKDERRMHSKPIARLGGLAIVSGFFVSTLFNAVSSPYIFRTDKKLMGLIVGICIIVAMGVIDDIKPLRARTKLAFQILAAIAVVVISDSRIDVITNPFSPLGYSQLNGWFSYAITIFWIVGITNAINLIDGLDGLAAGVASIASLSLFFISILRPERDLFTVYTALISITIAGATLGFLPHNFNPAKIFMAESGSAFLGFTLGVIAIQGTIKAYATVSIALPVLVLGLPLFDTTFAIIRRLLSGKPIGQGDRGHLHHRLIDMGLSHKQSVVVMYTASAALGLCAIVLADRGPLSAIILLLAVSTFIVGGAKYMNEINRDDDLSKDEDSPSLNTPDITNTQDQIDDTSCTELPVHEIKPVENT